jgi:hypothetical protein
MPILDPDLASPGTVDVVRGSDADWPVQATSQGQPMVFASADTLAGQVYRGQDQAPLFTASAAWASPSGYSTGSAVVTATAAQTALLEAGGSYSLQLWWTAANASRKACIARRLLSVLPGPGAATQLVTPYCALQDLLDVAPWIRLVQSPDSDQEGFYSQRLQARTWMDQAIINCYRGAFVGLFETHSTAAFAFGYAGWRRSLGPSPSLIAYLQSNFLLVKPYIVKACAHHAAGLIGLAQIGLNNQQAALGAYHRDEADRLMCGVTAEVDLNADGIGELFISLDSTNSLFT